MEDPRSVRMNEEERTGFLGSGGTGVVSFAPAGDEPPYSLPVSYGYDAAGGHLYFRLAFGPDSGKDGVVDRPVSFVTYDHTDEGWKSVVATGRLEAVSEEAIDSESLEALGRVHIPLVDVFEDHPRAVTFRFFRLDPDELTGRKEARTES